MTIPLVLVAGLGALTVLTTDGCASFGAAASGARLERLRRSPRWKDGKFVNAEPTEVMTDGKWSATREWFDFQVMRAPTCELPWVRDTAERLKKPPATGLRVTWLGHSTTLIEIDGFRVLTDPQFSQRASPSQLVGPQRFHPPPMSLTELPPIDAVVVSHDHYDHLDMESIRALAKTGAPIHVALGVGAHLERWGVPQAQIRELDWFEEAVFEKGLRLVSTPARHFSGRFVARDTTLWTSWTLVGPSHRVFFSGDTGLTEAFNVIRERYGPFDLSMLEIGQFHHSWGSIHLGPLGALEAHRRLEAAHLLPIHWGTFQLGLHPWNEPPETLVTEAARRGVSVIAPRLGEPLEPLANQFGSPWWRQLPPLASQCPESSPAGQ